MMKIVQNCFDNKVSHVLKNNPPGKAALIFNHGLGDFCLFLPLFEELQKEFPDWDLYIGLKRGLDYFIHPKAITINNPYGSQDGKFDILFGIQYPEPPRSETESRYWLDKRIKDIKIITKPYLCNVTEIGLENFVWKPHKFNFNSIKKHRIGVHFFGHTSTVKKDCDINTAELIWKEIKAMGFEPFEMQMNPPHLNNCNENPTFVGNNTLRNCVPDVLRMAEEIAKCKYFIGVDSGPLYLAGSILGFDKCIALEKERKIGKVLPCSVSLVNINSYKETNILLEIYNKEKEDGKV